jgi:hypothetical protein
MSAQNFPGWSYGHCLFGVTGPAQMPFNAADYSALEVSKVEAIVVNPQDSTNALDELREAFPNLFVVIQVEEQIEETFAAYYYQGIRYFVVKRTSEVFNDQLSYDSSFLETVQHLKSVYPEAQIGFPGLPNKLQSLDQLQRFLDNAAERLAAADWIGVNCFWDNKEDFDSPLAGRLYETYLNRFPDKLLLLGIGNTNTQTPSYAKGQQYLEFYERVRPIPNIGAIFARVLSESGGHPTVVWRLDNGTLTDIPKIVGSRTVGDDLKQSAAQQRSSGTAGTDSSPADLTPIELVTRHRFDNDQPFGGDKLNYDAYARAFAQVLMSDETSTPLTVGIYGAWGMGKSFLMRRIGEMMGKPPENKNNPAERIVNPNSKYDFLFVDFNAWTYSGSQNLWAGLITKLYDDVEKYLGLRRTLLFRLGKNFQRSTTRTLRLLAVYGVLAVLVGLLFDFNEWLAQWETLRLALTGLAGSAVGVSALAALPALLNAIRDLFSSVTLKRSEQLADLSSRRDFRDKIGFMADIKSEIGEIRELLETGKSAKRPVRVFITIDDLDRCPPEKAVEVLEAIMLLLADKDGSPFIVLLGIDSRIIVKAIEAKYGKVLTDAGISGYEYLDKIVQIPFRIPKANVETRKGFVAQLLANSDTTRVATATAGSPASAKTGQDSQAQITETPTGSGQSGVPVSPSAISNQPAPDTATPFDPTARTDQPRVEVTFTKGEQKIFDSFANFLSANPRRIKRIVNIYRIARLLAPDLSHENREVLIKWVILSEQWPFRISWLLEEIENDDQRAAQSKLGRRYADDTNIIEVLRAIQPRLTSTAIWHVLLDDDPDLLGPFIQTQPAITVRDIRNLQPLAFNLNPAMQVEVLRANAATEPKVNVHESEDEEDK